MTETARSNAIGPARVNFGEKPIGLGRRLALLHLVGDPDVASVTVEPVTFTWTDCFDARIRRYSPDFLVERDDGSRTFVSTAKRTALRANPSLDGRRAHIEAECLSIGATFELWTEREVASAGDDRRVVLPAWGAARSAYLKAVRMPVTDVAPGIVRSVADRAGLRSLVRTPTGWVGRCELTGVPMAVLPGTLHMTPDGMVTWTPPAPRSHPPTPPTVRSAARHAKADAEVIA